jgi:hypothetical protein
MKNPREEKRRERHTGLVPRDDSHLDVGPHDGFRSWWIGRERSIGDGSVFARGSDETRSGRRASGMGRRGYESV